MSFKICNFWLVCEKPLNLDMAVIFIYKLCSKRQLHCPRPVANHLIWTVSFISLVPPVIWQYLDGHCSWFYTSLSLFSENLKTFSFLPFRHRQIVFKSSEVQLVKTYCQKKVTHTCNYLHILRILLNIIYTCPRKTLISRYGSYNVAL